MKRLCARCVRRDAACRTDIDGREFWVCADCVSEPDDPGYVIVDPVDEYRQGRISLAAAAVKLATQHNGIQAEAVGDLLHASALERNAISTALRRAIRAGSLREEGEGMEREFYPASRKTAPRKSAQPEAMPW